MINRLFSYVFVGLPWWWWLAFSLLLGALLAGFGVLGLALLGSEASDPPDPPVL